MPQHKPPYQTTNRSLVGTLSIGISSIVRKSSFARRSSKNSHKWMVFTRRRCFPSEFLVPSLRVDFLLNWISKDDSVASLQIPVIWREGESSKNKITTSSREFYRHSFFCRMNTTAQSMSLSLKSSLTCPFLQANFLKKHLIYCSPRH